LKVIQPFAGLGEGAHHPAVQVPGRQLAGGLPRRARPPICCVELVPPQVNELGRLLRVEQRPGFVGLDPAHELVRISVGEVQVVGAAGVLAGVVPQVEELLNVECQGSR
jgi:hypothetical protein